MEILNDPVQERVNDEITFIDFTDMKKLKLCRYKLDISTQTGQDDKSQ
jgi:hypothetical protein